MFDFLKRKEFNEPMLEVSSLRERILATKKCEPTSSREGFWPLELSGLYSREEYSRKEAELCVVVEPEQPSCKDEMKSYNRSFMLLLH